ncbi:hypothetical protein ACRQ5Q_41995 (plasmid) [Bradyrhizobium sp. PMVTL-01]|uniref:hypothetical protein n=1 Tax=Bradyrhizobium sp. PMVTL-01 TaxID=3434999 RepID=UPI003F703369
MTPVDRLPRPAAVRLDVIGLRGAATMRRKAEWIAKAKEAIDDLLSSVELHYVNGWEIGFLENMKVQLDKTGSLTDKQEAKLLPLLRQSRKWG